MSVTVYQIPMEKWSPGQPKPKNLDKYHVVADGDDHEEALRQLVQEVNEERVDDVNCYLFVDEDKVPQLTNIVKLNLKNTCRDLAIEFTFREHERRREVVELAEILVETGGKVEVSEKYTETYDKWYDYFQNILKQNFV